MVGWSDRICHYWGKKVVRGFLMGTICVYLWHKQLRGGTYGTGSRGKDKRDGCWMMGRRGWVGSSSAKASVFAHPSLKLWVASKATTDKTADLRHMSGAQTHTYCVLRLKDD